MADTKIEDAMGGAAEMAVTEDIPVGRVKTEYAEVIDRIRPRNLKEVVRRCIEEAELGGDTMYYRFPVQTKNKKTGAYEQSYIIGPSIGMMLAAARNFGNIHICQKPIIDTPTAWIFTTAIITLEPPFMIYERTFRMSKGWTIYGKFDEARKEDMRFAIGQSKATRNALNNFIPTGITDKMMDAAMNSVRNNIQTRLDNVFAGDIRKLIASDVLPGYGKFDVTVDMLVGKTGLDCDHWDIHTLVELAGDLKALKRGTETVSTLYGGSDEPTAVQPPTMTIKDGEAVPQMTAGDVAEHQGHDYKPEPTETREDVIKDILEIEDAKGFARKLLARILGRIISGSSTSRTRR